MYLSSWNQLVESHLSKIKSIDRRPCVIKCVYMEAAVKMPSQEFGHRESQSARTRTLLRSALARIHSAGYVHGDIARCNFCEKADVVFLVDSGTLAELAKVDAL